MENAIQMFKFENKQEIRVIQGENGAPWFIASDLCKALEYSNASKALSDHVDPEDKAYITQTLGQNIPPITNSYTPGSSLLVNESGVYSLILRSEMPEAKRFKRWVTSEVLPAIRKTGTYSIVKQEDMSPAKALLIAVQQIVEHEQILAEHDHRLMAMESRLSTMDEGSQYFTVLAYARIRGTKIDNSTAQVYGMKASRWSKQNGYPVGHAPDARFGTVGTYHIDALEVAFGIKG